jgi:hypothetical protein
VKEKLKVGRPIILFWIKIYLKEDVPIFLVNLLGELLVVIVQKNTPTRVCNLDY